MDTSTIMPNVRDAQQTPLYDTYTAAAAASVPNSISFFNSRTKSANGHEVTNIEQAAQIPNGLKFTVYGMGFVAIDPDYSDLVKLYKQYAAVLKIGGKEYLEAPMEFFPGGAGISGFAAVSTTVTATTSTIKNFNNGEPHPAAVQMFAPENALVIPGGLPFGVTLSGATGFTATAAVFLRCYLFGVFEKFVQ